MRATDAILRSYGRAAVVAALLAAFSGCGGGNPKTYPVTGVVMYGGAPVSDVSVAFNPENGRTAVGRTDFSGRFTLTTYSPNDGAVAGKHRVTFSPVSATEAGTPTTDDDYKPVAAKRAPFPPKYLTLETSDLVVDVPGDTGAEGFTLDLK